MMTQHKTFWSPDRYMGGRTAGQDRCRLIGSLFVAGAAPFSQETLRHALPARCPRLAARGAAAAASDTPDLFNISPTPPIVPAFCAGGTLCRERRCAAAIAPAVMMSGSS
jgi:hypothetical protein